MILCDHCHNLNCIYHHLPKVVLRCERCGRVAPCVECDYSVEGKLVQEEENNE